MRWLVSLLLILLLLAQYQLWSGSGSLPALWRLEQSVAVQREENAALKERNEALEAEVLDLKQGMEAVEERARNELGMIKEGETFYQVIKEK